MPKWDSPWNPLPPRCCVCGNPATELRGPDAYCAYHAELYDEDRKRDAEEEADD